MRSPRLGAALCLPLALFLAGAFAVPMGALLPESLEATSAASSTEPGLLANYARALAEDGGRTAFRNSLLLSISVAAASLVLCLPPAWMLARHRFRGAGLLRLVLALPLTFSGVIVGFLAVLMLGRLGLVPALGRVLAGEPILAGSAYTLGGLAAAYVYFEVPRATLTLEAALRRVPSELEDAAATLGAGARSRLFRVVLPMVAPALGSTLAVTFAASMGSFGVALILARRFTVVPLEIYTEATGFLDTGYAAALCLLLAVVTLAANGLLRRLSRGGEWVYG